MTGSITPGDDRRYMAIALAEARLSLANDDVPVGAVVVNESGQMLARAHNVREERGDPTGHAEVEALRIAGAAQGSWNLADCTLYVTLEPCTMCAGAIVLARIRRLVFGAWDAKAGAAGSVRDAVRDTRLNHRVEVITGVCATESAELLSAFFAARRER